MSDFSFQVGQQFKQLWDKVTPRSLTKRPRLSVSFRRDHLASGGLWIQECSKFGAIDVQNIAHPVSEPDAEKQL